MELFEMVIGGSGLISLPGERPIYFYIAHPEERGLSDRAGFRARTRSLVSLSLSLPAKGAGWSNIQSHCRR